MDRIRMNTPLVEMDGDEMTRILWGKIKDTLILPFVDLKTEYYDLGLLHRNETQDAVTREAAEAALRLGVAVKCATITPNAARMEEYPELTKMWKSPNATIRSIMGGTVFRTPVITSRVAPVVNTWKKPITIARHAYGDIYAAVEIAAEEAGTCRLVFTGENGTEERVVKETAGPAVFLGQHNTVESIRDFAKACFAYALNEKKDLWFSAKDTISQTYDGMFKQVFEEEYEAVRPQFEEAGISFFYTLIDDAVSRIMRSEGGFIWACKNYDGDVMSDMVSSAFGSLAMMTSVLVNPDGKMEFEAAHGTVTRHYYRHLKGEETSTNPTATIFAWSGALKKRGELDGLAELTRFGERMEEATLATIEAGTMTGDLYALTKDKETAASVTTDAFLSEIAKRL